MLFLIWLLAAPPAGPSPDPRSPGRGADAPPPGISHRERDDDHCAQTWQIDGGITWLRLTWQWKGGQPVDPLDGCGGSGLLRLEDSSARPIGFVRVTLSDDGATKTERWRWSNDQAWPGSFYVRPMRYDPEAGLDDSTTWEAKINAALAEVGEREQVVSEHWSSAFSRGDSFTWTGFSPTASAVPKAAGDVWFIGTPGGGAAGPTLYLRATSGDGGAVEPVAWYATSPHDVHLRGAAPYVSFRRGSADEVPDTLHAGRHPAR